MKTINTLSLSALLLMIGFASAHAINVSLSCGYSDDTKKPNPAHSDMVTALNSAVTQCAHLPAQKIYQKQVAQCDAKHPKGCKDHYNQLFNTWCGYTANLPATADNATKYKAINAAYSDRTRSVHCSSNTQGAAYGPYYIDYFTNTRLQACQPDTYSQTLCDSTYESLRHKYSPTF